MNLINNEVIDAYNNLKLYEGIKNTYHEYRGNHIQLTPVEIGLYKDIEIAKGLFIEAIEETHSLQEWTES